MIVAAIVFALFQAAQAPPTDADEAALRLAVQQYYEAQTNKDPDKAAAFWSTAANPRMSREAFVAMFGAGDAKYSTEVQAVKINGTEGRVRVAVVIARTIVRNDVPTISRLSQINAELWRKEPSGWKLLREGPVAEDFADELLAADAAGRGKLIADNPGELTRDLRYVLGQRASRLAAMTQYAKAREIFLLALDVARASNDRRSESETLQNIANAYYFLLDFETATDFYRQRLALSRELQDQEGEAASILGIATIEYSRGEYTAALASYREALAIYEKRADGTSIGRALVSVGNVQYLQAEYDAAAASYRRALDLLVTGMDPQGASLARNGLGLVFGAQGDLAAALQMYSQVLADARKGIVIDPRLRSAVAGPLESIGELYYRLGNVEQARKNLEEARTLSTAPGDLARLSAALGLTELIAGRYDAALAAYTESRTRYEQANDAAGIGRAWVGIGFSQAAREKWPEAMTAYRTAIAKFDAQKMVEEAARAWLGLSMAQSGTGDHLEALRSARKVAADAVKVASDDLVWRAGVRAGEALRLLKRFGEARAEFDHAIAAIDTLALSAPINPDARSQLDDSASAWTGLAFVAAAQHDPRAALAAGEARRAHIRRMQLAGFHRDIVRGMTADEQADEQALVRELISTRAQLRAERNLPHPDAARIEKIEKQRATLLARRTDQQSKLYARLPELQRWRGLQPVVADDLTTAIFDPRTVAVEYLFSDDELLAITIARGEQKADLIATITPVDHKELTEQIAAALKPEVLKDAAEWRRLAQPLFDELVAPVLTQLHGRERVVVIPDDLLWKVPFEALPAGETPFGAGAQVTYATSLATLALQQQIAAARAPQPPTGAVVFTAPEIPADVRAQLTLAQSGWKEPEREESVRIAADVALAYRETVTLRSDAEASEAAARAALETADVLQFGGPVHVSGVSPMLSMVALSAGGDAIDNDGRWELRDWFRTNGHARVLVLTDGSSFATPGSGSAMDAFAWAAAAAGASTLVVGRWPVDGFSRDAVIVGLHRGLAIGRTPAEAWSAAIAAARAAGEAPARWTGLRLIGAGR